MLRLLAISLMALSFAAPAQPTPPREEPKWFVLRDHQVGACWTALLVKIDGTYRHGFAQTAGGPYATEEQALQRRKALQETRACSE
jgi:hypothetical protein